MKNTFGTGAISDGRLYTVSAEGIAECYDLKDGKSLWQERLSGPGAQTGCWSSVTLAEGRLYVPNKSGDVFVLRAGPKFEVLSVNSLKEPTNASIAASDGALFVRTDKALWCIAAPQR
jgi:outer membrane protein assembly factor BamB